MFSLFLVKSNLFAIMGFEDTELHGATVIDHIAETQFLRLLFPQTV